MHTGQMEKRKPVPLTLLGVICDKEKREKVIGVLEEHCAHFSLVCLGRGTANSKILSYLGLGETEKRIFFNVMPLQLARDVMQHMNDILDFSKPGHGVAFMSAITAGCYHRIVDIPKETDGGEAVEQKSVHDLILVILNRGYTEEVMDAARGAGATGGTVLHARGIGLAGAEKFFGVTIQPEKEMIMILAKSEVSCGIMSEIAAQTGPESDAGAVSFSMPISSVMGIGRDVPESVL